MFKPSDISRIIKEWITGDGVSRQRADWMTFSDDRILEFLQESGAGHNYRGIEVNTLDRGDKISYSTIKRRIPKLLKAGFVRKLPGQGNYFAITDRGETYLAGELDASALDEPE